MSDPSTHPGELPDDEYLRSEAILDAYDRGDYKRAAELETEQLAAERARVEGGKANVDALIAAICTLAALVVVMTVVSPAAVSSAVLVATGVALVIAVILLAIT